MRRTKAFSIAAGLAATALAASAQTSSVTVYGDIDQYLN
jgi:predicted porin